MDTFYIITNYQKDPDLETAQAIQQYLEKKVRPVTFSQMKQGITAEHISIPMLPVCRMRWSVCSSSGDGTLLQAARDLVERQLPLLGINMGTLGYLAEIDRKSICPALEKLITGEYSIEHRMMLCGSACHQNRKMLADIALNDIVITRNGRLRVVDFNVYVDGAFLSSFTADGIIISTPTGSTGYNLSVGGPIVAPEASLMLLTAIAPHTLNARPIVLPDDVEIAIEIGTSHGTDIDGAEATFDGDTSVKLNAGDRVVIHRSNREALMIKTKNTSFLEILREKMSR